MTTAADIAARVGLEDPATFWERNRKGRTTMMLLNVVAALADGWECTVTAPEFTSACELWDQVRKMAERANVAIQEHQLHPRPEDAAYALADAGYFEPEAKRALFTDDWRPRGVITLPASWKPEAMLDEGDARVKAMRADQARAAAAPPPQLHRATRRTRKVTRCISAGNPDDPSDFTFQEETIHEVLEDRTASRLVQARWMRVLPPQPTT